LHKTLGAHSPLVAEVRALKTKRGRRNGRAYIVEGATLLGEALDAGAALRLLLGSGLALDAHAALAARAACAVYEVTEAVLAKLSDLSTPPGLLAVVERRESVLGDVLHGEPAVLLAGVSDPGNAGTLLRAAEIFGINTALFTPASVEPWNPKLVRSAMGAIFRMHICVAAGPAIASAAKANGYRIVATDATGVPLPSYSFAPRSIVAVGNERRGVEDGLERWDDRVSIPQLGEGESLNAAVAGGIVLYAFSLARPADLSSLGGPESPCYTAPRT
jgi:TrmH family RNA methyltransferase